MRLRTFAFTFMMMVFAAVVHADPVHVAFNTPGYGPSGVQSFTRTEATVNRDFTFEALDAALNPSGVLTHWDDDGFGIIGAGNYANDEIEGNERLMLRFNEAVNVTAFDVTDFFYEIEPNTGNCPIAGCYTEILGAMFFYEDGTHSLFDVRSAPLVNLRSTTNGAAEFKVNEVNVVAMMLLALGQLGPQLHDVAWAGVTVDTLSEVPEPTTLFLLGTGLIGLTRLRKKA